MLRIDRYLLRELLMPLLVGLGTFVVMITGHMLFTVVDKIVEHGVGMPSVLKFMALQVPFALLLSLPASSLLAASLALNRLASENELTALRAGGAGFGRILRPLLGLGLGASLLALLLASSTVPWANRQAEMLIQRIIAQQPALAFRPGKFTSTQTGLDFFAESVDKAQRRLSRLFVFQRLGGGLPWLFHAEAAEFTEHGLVTGPATFYSLSPDGDREWGRMDRVEVNLGSLRFLPGMISPTVSHMSMAELRAEQRRLEAESPGGGRRYAVELHWRISLAFACLAFVTLALPVTMRLGRGQSLVGVLATLLVAFVYYVIMLWLRMAAEAGSLPPLIAAWLQNAAIFVAAGLALWRQR